jgi:hypothetical protein
MKTIKNFIYLDMDKVSSLYSQLTGGIIQKTESSSTSSNNNKNHRNYDLKVFKHEAGGSETQSSQFRETRISHLIANLKKDSFIENDIEATHYLFGSKPTVKVSMLGIITSIPKKEEDEFSPMFEFENNDSANTSHKHEFEGAFRGMFRGFDGLEELIRTCRYPRIMVQPIAIYREVKPNTSLVKNTK